MEMGLGPSGRDDGADGPRRALVPPWGSLRDPHNLFEVPTPAATPSKPLSTTTIITQTAPMCHDIENTSPAQRPPDQPRSRAQHGKPRPSPLGLGTGRSPCQRRRRGLQRPGLSHAPGRGGVPP